MFGSTEIIIIVLIIFLLFGAKSIPKFARSLGEARKELQKGLSESTDTSDDENKQQEKKDLES